VTPLLEVEQLSVAYGRVQAVRDVSLVVEEGSLVSLVGANGAGKTTILAAITGLVAPHAGRVRLRGRDVTRRRPAELVRLGIVQVPEGRQILQQMTVQENLDLGGYQRRDRTTLKREIEVLLDRFPILRARRQAAAGTLSGGEQQLLAIARGLLARPALLLLDEPSMGLAPQLVSQVFTILREIHAEGRTILLVEQNARKALAISDRAYVLETGEVVLEGSGADLANDPRIVAAYLGGVGVGTRGPAARLD
jgi:branched-chain amino acid transport system ATP-binding protein